MKRKILLFTTATTMVLSSTVNAQDNEPQPQPTQNQSPESICLTDENFRAFDFWLGDWSVTTNGSNRIQGTNSITSIERGCALLEKWTSATGGTGMSTNHYDPTTGKWRQVWLSAGAYSIDIEGGLLNGSMALKGTIAYYGTGKRFPFRGTWVPLLDGTVRQHFEQFNPEKDEWATWFDGIYTRTNGAQE